MAKNLDVCTKNELYAARKEKARALLDAVAKPFNRWKLIRDFIDYGMLGSIMRDDAKLPDLLKTGYVAIVEPEPCEKALSVTLADSNRVALQPTEKGIVAYYWHTKYNQQIHETSAAYSRGKKDAFVKLCRNMADSLDLDFEDVISDCE